MKKKLVFTLLGVVIAVTVGMPQLQQFISLSRNDKNLQNQISITASTYADMQEQLNLADESLQKSGRAACLDSVSIAIAVSFIIGAELQNVTAIGAVDGILGDVFMTSDINELAGLTSDISQLKFAMTVTDADAFLSSVKELDLLYDSISVNTDSKQADIVVPVVTGSYVSVKADVGSTELPLNDAESVLDSTEEVK